MADRHLHLSKQCAQLWEVVHDKYFDDAIAQLMNVRLGLDHLKEVIHTTANQLIVILYTDEHLHRDSVMASCDNAIPSQDIACASV